MGTILSRKRKNGTTGHTVVIRFKRKGIVVHFETQTFDRLQAANLWMKKREAELAEPGALERGPDPTLAQAIERYNADTLRPHGKTKDQVLRTISASWLGALPCSQIRSHTVVEYLQGLTSQPQTRGNYLSHLSSVFAVARPAWGYPLDKAALDDARVVADKLGLIRKSRQRTRRPTLDELDRLLTHFAAKELKRSNVLPMTLLVLFAIFSTRRQDEICRITAEDLNAQGSEVVVRDMKNPGEKIGNDVTTTLTPEALRLIQRHGAATGRIWPYNADSVSSSFTNACKVLGIDDLHFHDLRHDGISRLFELGWSIPRVACVSGHRTWQSLQRYTHLKQTGDKYKGWAWLERVFGGE